MMRMQVTNPAPDGVLKTSSARRLLWACQRLRLLVLAAGLTVLTACGTPGLQSPATQTPDAVQARQAVPVILVPATSMGRWYDLGVELAPWLGGFGPVPSSSGQAPTRVVGLQNDDGRWLAVVVVQPARDGQVTCPDANGLRIDGGEHADRCLQLRRDADFDHWLEQQHPVLFQWLADHDWSSRPRAWVGYRSSGGPSGLEVNVLLDPWLLEPVTRNTVDFLAAGEPGRLWAQDLARGVEAGRAAAIKLPPFPFAAFVRDPVLEEAAPAAEAGQAEQLTPEETAPVMIRPPRQDRQ